MENEIDKRVFNVENSIVAEGGTAIDLLETLPSVQVDEEGGISMRGSGNILIYINGRPTNMMGDDTESILAQFPANSIQKVELISNPSARYDAEGIGGIINIILKKNQKQGLNGSVTSGMGFRTVNEFLVNQYNAGTNLNYRAGKWNLFGGYNYQYNQMFMESESVRENLRSPLNTSRYLDQDFYTEMYNQSHLLRGGFDYEINDKMTIGVSAQGNLRSRERERIYNIRSMNQLEAYNPNDADFINALDSMYIRDLNEEVTRQNYELALTFNYDIDTLGQKLYASFSFARDQQQREELFLQEFRDTNFDIDPSRFVDQILARPQESDFMIAQIDYEKPLRENGKLELGLKSTLRREIRRQQFRESIGEPGVENPDYVFNEQVSGDFAFNEDVHAAYAIYKDKFGKFGLQAGLRTEYTAIDLFDPTDNSKLVNPLTNVTYEDQTPYFNLFPSLYLTYELAKNTDLQI
jgi:iron complex outermembrane recepter protein